MATNIAIEQIVVGDSIQDESGTVAIKRRLHSKWFIQFSDGHTRRYDLWTHVTKP